MIRRITFNTQPLSISLKYSEIRTYIIIALFTFLNLLVPWALYRLDMAGPTFLPLQFFVVVAALTCGWQAGLIVGVLTPITAYFVSGMPQGTVLAQIMVEIIACGVIAGVLRWKYNLRVIWALLGAMVGGRLIMFVAIIVIHFVTGSAYSPLGNEPNPNIAFWDTIRISWPGIVLHLVLIPIIFQIADRITRRKRSE